MFGKTFQGPVRGPMVNARADAPWSLKLEQNPQLPPVVHGGEHSVSGLFDRLGTRQRNADRGHSIGRLALGVERGRLHGGDEERPVHLSWEARAGAVERN